MKGKPWTADEETLLKQLVDVKTPLEVMSVKLQKTSDAVIQKCRRLGLEVVGLESFRTSTSIQMPTDLPSVEEALKMLAGALRASLAPGLDKVEVQRLQVVATLARTYKEVLADYINYRAIEVKLVELEAKYARLLEEKTKGNTS